MVNLRGRTDLLCDNLCGNVYTAVHWKSTAEATELRLHGLVGLMRDAITTSLAKLANAIDGEDLAEMVMNLAGEYQEELRNGGADVLFFSPVGAGFHCTRSIWVGIRCLVECEDQGVEFLEAKVDGTLDQFLHGETDLDDVLNHLATQPHPVDQIAPPLVVVQMSTFTCGGIAVGLRFAYRIADMHTMSSFLSTWAMACRGSIHKAIRPRFDLSSILPPRDLPKLEPPAILMPAVHWKSMAEATELGLHGLVGLMQDAITTSLAKLANGIDGEDLAEMVMNLAGEYQEELRNGGADCCDLPKTAHRLRVLDN
ncbi:hypothetical protein NL676_039203 [Syzygium grande]|nr:hypothetical protein NL676_039203 [Syzygium grande]